MLKVAWRNLWRNRTRTLTMGSAVAFSYALLLVSMGIGDYMHGRMEGQAAEVAGGEVLVHGAGWWDTRASDVLVVDADAVLAAVAEVDGVRRAIPRVVVSGLVGAASGSRPVQLLGIRPELETALKDPSEDLVEGEFLGGGEAAPLVLGARIVEDIDIELGDRVVLTATEPDGEIARALFHLTGVIRTGTPQLDRTLAYTTLEAARDAIGLAGGLTQIGVTLDDGVANDVVADRIRAALGGRADALEVLTWQDAMPQMVGYIEIDDAFLYLYGIVIFVVVAFAITNTFLMAVMERVRELGLLSALGLRDGRIARMLLSETAFLAVLAMAAGLVLALGGHLAIRHFGIDVAAMYGTSELEVSGVDVASMILRSEIRPPKWVAASVGVVALVFASALYPAWRATRLAPAQAMRFYD